jgi:hypothetical protein
VIGRKRPIVLANSRIQYARSANLSADRLLRRPMASKKPAMLNSDEGAEVTGLPSLWNVT